MEGVLVTVATTPHSWRCTQVHLVVESSSNTHKHDGQATGGYPSGGNPSGVVFALGTPPLADKLSVGSLG